MKCQREKFQLQRKYAYLNCGYMSPLLRKVEKAGIKAMRRKRKPFHITNTDFFSEGDVVRRLFSELIGNDEPERVVITPSVSYGIANVVHNLPFTEGEIVMVEEQFPSNVYSWTALQTKGFEVKTISAPNSPNRAEDWNSKLLEAITEKTRVVALGQVHWSDGTLFRLNKIREKLDAVGGLLIVDGTQSIGAMPFDIKDCRPDAVICAGYKWLMGPYSIGLAYYGPVFDGGTPIEQSWMNRIKSDDFAGLVNYQEEFRPKALRYEVGEHSNFILLPMLHAALKQILRWTPENIQDYCKQLTLETWQELAELGYKFESSKWRGEHLVGMRLPKKVKIDELQLALKKHRVSISLRGDAVRIAPHVYNDEMDMRKLLKAMKQPILAQKK